MLLFAEMARPMFGKLIQKDSNVEKAILEKGINFQLEDVGMDYYRKIKQRDGFFGCNFLSYSSSFLKERENIQKKHIYTVL